MTKAECKNWLINISNSAAAVSAEYGDEVVDFILSKYGAKSIEALNPNDYSEVFSELYLIEMDA